MGRSDPTPLDVDPDDLSGDEPLLGPGHPPDGSSVMGPADGITK
jgi:hypothetical protein